MVLGLKSWSSTLSKRAINWHINSRDQSNSVIPKTVPWGTARASLSFHRGSRAPAVRARASGVVPGAPPWVPTRVRGGCEAHACGPWMGEIPPPKV